MQTALLGAAPPPVPIKDCPVSIGYTPKLRETINDSFALGQQFAMQAINLQQQRAVRCLCGPAAGSLRMPVRRPSTTTPPRIQFQQPMAPLMPSSQTAVLEARRQRWVCSQAAGSSSSSSSSSSSDPAGGRNWLGWFDRLPPKMQMGLLGGLLFVGMFIIPFLQPTFLYGDASKQAAGQHAITDVVEASPPVKYSLPCYIPGASELYDFLQENSMPRTLPDGRSESPGVFRIYMSSMIILAVFYMFSAVVSLILRGVAGVLRAVGIMGPAPPPKPDDEA